MVNEVSDEQRCTDKRWYSDEQEIQMLGIFVSVSAWYSNSNWGFLGAI